MLLAGDIGGTKTALAIFSADRGPRAPVAAADDRTPLIMEGALHPTAP